MPPPKGVRHTHSQRAAARSGTLRHTAAHCRGPGGQWTGAARHLATSGSPKTSPRARLREGRFRWFGRRARPRPPAGSPEVCRAPTQTARSGDAGAGVPRTLLDEVALAGRTRALNGRGQRPSGLEQEPGRPHEIQRLGQRRLTRHHGREVARDDVHQIRRAEHGLGGFANWRGCRFLLTGDRFAPSRSHRSPPTTAWRPTRQAPRLPAPPRRLAAAARLRELGGLPAAIRTGTS